MKHKDKLKLARKMITSVEVNAHISPFNSEAWNNRLESNRRRVAKREAEAKLRAEARKKAKELLKNQKE